MILTDRTNVAISLLEQKRLRYSIHSRMSATEIADYNSAIDTVQELLHSALIESQRNSRDLKPRLQVIYDLLCNSGDDSQWVAYSCCAGILEKLLK